MTLKNCGAAEVIEEKDLTAERLTATVSELLSDTDKLAAMSEKAHNAAIIDANDRIYKVILELYTKN
jgi:UDP-N-acetylglucosamine--N-acetylmuramyl-(pentapeptide) pyrophosphoryl-undecaprenol N-acetylglucosamine transferase